jgi:hypothetical protein
MEEGVQRALMSKDSVKVIVQEGMQNAWTDMILYAHLNDNLWARRRIQ